ncbi:MAG: ABC transporter ATP-binding protein [Hyphomicrobiaceae bacterium]
MMIQPPTSSNAAVGTELELKALHASYGTNHVVKGIDLALGKGELVSLLGPSGCGKSTTLRLIAGLEIPDSGTILVRGNNITNDPPHRRAMGVMFQDYALFPHMSLEKNVGYGLKVRGEKSAKVKTRAAEMLDLVGLSHLRDRLPGALSGGQKQRVALARALAIEPAVLLLDEPFSALDRHLRLQMQTEIRRIQRATSVATIFVTHDQEEALAISDRIAVMSEGAISDIGTPQRIYDNPASRFALDFIGGRTSLPVKVVRVTQEGVVCVPKADPAQEVLVERCLERGPLPGEECDLALRCEQFQVSDRPISGLQCIPAKVIDRIFVGTQTHFTLDVGGVELATLEPSARDTLPETPGTVYACWPAGAGWLL